MRKRCIRGRALKRIVTLWVAGQVLTAAPAIAQFSPGDLSRPHQAFEGTQNCTKCHEVGREISGAKCLGCHLEIQQSVRAKQGYHYSVATRACVTCHKEHLGKDARTVQFDEKTFDHDQTGFPLGGRHSTLTCERCHTSATIVERTVKDLLATYPHRSYLGLSPTCNSCHRDPHGGKFKQECMSCHSPAGWKSVNNFDHSKTRFLLDGKHMGTACVKCHPGMAAASPAGQGDFKTAGFTDCTPCHTSPHLSRFGERACSACHSTAGWTRAIEKPFDHTLTRYRLAGAHSALRCTQCHHTGNGSTFADIWLLPRDKCIRCHEDKHHGEFAKQYNNNCASCHSENAYKPSTFTIARHERSAFPLTGAHLAVTCSECHADSSRSRLVFHVKDQRCESCHHDVHHGQFAAIIGGSGCNTCHATEDWKRVTFDHSKTVFPLLGKHAAAACSDCHNKRDRRDGAIQFAKLPSACESCHRDIHQAQFATLGKTDCSNCHNPERWASPTFDHETQSSFSLKGAHKSVACTGCHHVEGVGQGRFLRFKPLASACASCHRQGELK